MDTLILSPYLGAIVGVLLQTLLLLGRVWERTAAKDEPDGQSKTEGTRTNPRLLVTSGRALVAGLYFGFGVILLDIGLGWLLGAGSHLDWRFQLPSVLLCFVLGAEFAWGAKLLHPTRLDLVYCTCAALVIVFLLHVYVPAHPNMRDPFTTTLGVAAGFAVLNIPLELGKRVTHGFPAWTKTPAWACTTPYRRVFRTKVVAVLGAISFLQVVLIFEGTSLFLW